LNFVARKGPINVLRRDALLAELVTDYQPDTTLLRSTCEDLAATLERLENTKAGSIEWQRLVQVKQLLGATLEASRRPGPSDVSDLTEREFEERFARLQQMRDLLQWNHEHAKDEIADEHDIPSTPTETAPAPEPLPPETVCEFCSHPLSHCRELKVAGDEAWDRAHARDPRWIAEREAKAREIRRKLGWDVGVIGANGVYRRYE